MPASRNSFFDHFKWFRSAAASAGAQGFVTLEGCHAMVRWGEQQRVFHPQFQATVRGVLQYQPVFTDDTTRFAGWLPYRLKQWDIAVDKLAFKRYAEAVGLATPRYWLAPGDDTRNVVVKTPRSSFGRGVDGPFRLANARALDLSTGEFYEEFIEGWILKIWFWNEQPICAEMEATPAVQGDGASTLRSLISRRIRSTPGISETEEAEMIERCGVVVHYFGRQLDDILPARARQMIEFRYGTHLMLARDRRVVRLDTPERPEWFDQAVEAGRKLFDAIPKAVRAHTAYTVDAVLARDGKLQLLEMNCNPAMHPLVYPAMVADVMQAVALQDREELKEAGHV